MAHAPQEIRTFFITSIANRRRPIFREQNMACLLMDVMQENRKLKRFLLHEFAVMPDHLHLILTPAPNVSLEKAVQYIKGGFSFRAKKEIRYKHLIWEESFNDHRIQDDEGYEQHREYIHHNPVKAGLVKRASEYPYSSASIKCDPKPPWLKPRI